MRLVRIRPVSLVVTLVLVALLAAACYPPPAPGLVQQPPAPAAAATLAPTAAPTSVPTARVAITATASVVAAPITVTLPTKVVTTTVATKVVTATMTTKVVTATLPAAAAAKPVVTSTMVLSPTVAAAKAAPTATAKASPTATKLPPTAVAPAAAPKAAAAASLTLDQLKNATYSSEFIQEGQITLKDGKYEASTGPGATQKVVTTLVEPIALGDLNADGMDDAVVVLGTNTGGSGVFMYLHVVLNDGARLKEAAFAPMGDRVRINALTIIDDTIELDVLTHAPNDPLCCPTQEVLLTYKLDGENLLLVSTMQKPTIRGSAMAPVTRTITFTTPTEGQSVKTGLSVSGSVSVTPFENNLNYRVYGGGNGQIIGSGSIKVTGEQGKPGQFSGAVQFAVGKEQIGRIEVLDIDVATGETLARGAVNVSFGKAMKAFTGKSRTITITAPKPGDAVSSPVQLAGETTLTPFEKNLSYRIYQNGKVIGGGPIMVKGDMNGPATFDVQAEFKAAGADPLSIQVLDQDMATGFIIAEAWVEVFLK